MTDLSRPSLARARRAVQAPYRLALGTLLVAVVLGAASTTADAQQRVSRRIAVDSNVAVKVWVSAGSIKLVGWDRDSLVVEGTIGKGDAFFFGGAGAGAKFGVDDLPGGKLAQPVDLVAYVPRRGRVSVRSVTGSIEANNLSGAYNTVSGDIRVSGKTDDLQAEAMDGAIHINVTSPIARARTGSGSLEVGGYVEDLSAATVSGPITITTEGIIRGRFETVTGTVVIDAPIERAASIDVDSHNGAVDLRLPPALTGDFELTSVTGTISNGFDKRAPVVGRQGRGQELVFVTSAKGPRIVVRTFKGPIALRARTGGKYELIR